MTSVLKGRAHRFVPNDDINTDYIISGRYKFKIDEMSKLAEHVMEDIAPGFARDVAKGDFVVAGANFGCGSSREQAPRALKAAGVSAILAESFARIFYRNSFNIGLPLVQCETDWISHGDVLEVDLASGTVSCPDRGLSVKSSQIPQTMRVLLEDGGLVPHIQKNKGFALD